MTDPATIPSDLNALLLSLASVLIAWLATTLRNYIAAKTTSAKTALVMQRLESVITTVVAELEQTEVPKIRAALDPNSPGGLAITGDEAKDLVFSALTKIARYVGKNGIEDTRKVLGFDTNEQLSEYLRGRIEEAVFAHKTFGATLRSTGTP